MWSSLIALVLAAGPAFVDVTEEVGLPAIRFASGFMPATAGAGWLDWDGDGHADVLLGGDEEPVRLMRSTGPPQWRFEDVTDAAGLTDVRGVIAVDVMVVAGAPALVFAAQPSEELWELQVWRRSEAGGAFEKTVVSRTLAPYLLSHGDLDGDGDHDLVASLAIECSSLAREPIGLVRYDNDVGLFRPVRSAPWPAPGCLGVPVVTDVGATGRPVVLSTNDYGVIHVPTTVIGDSLRRDLPRVYGMGIAAGDVNGDLASDYFLTSIREDALLLSGPGDLAEADASPGGRAVAYGETGSRVKWGAAYFDADNDGELDLYATAGFLETSPVWPNDSLQRSILLHRGEDVAAAAGLATETRDTTASVVDYDEDGRPDLLVGAVSAWQLFRNVSDAGRWLQVAIPDAPGARVVVDCGDKRQMREHTGGVAGTAGLPVLHFGLGDCPGPAAVTVHWPWAGKSRLEAVSLDQRVAVARPRFEVAPTTVTPGGEYTVTWTGSGAAEVAGTPLTGEPPQATFTAPDEVGDIVLESTVAGSVWPLAPRVRVLAAEHLDVVTDPDPLPRGLPAVVRVRASQAGDLGAAIDGGGLIEVRQVAADTLEVELVAASESLELTVTRDGAAYGQPLTMETAPAVDGMRSELRARRYNDVISLSLVPYDRVGLIPTVPAEAIEVLRDGEPAPDVQFEPHELNGFVATATPGGHLSVVVAGVTLDTTVDTARVLATRALDPARSLLFPLYEKARADGQDLVTVVLRPLDEAGHDVPLEEGPPLSADGLTTEGGWEPLSIGTVPMYAAHLRAGTDPGVFTIRAGALTTTVELVSMPRAAPAEARSEIRFESDPARLVIIPRDERGHLVGSGVDITITTDPSTAATASYTGDGQYEWRGEAREVSVTLDGAVTLRATSPTWTAPPPAEGCQAGPTPSASWLAGLLLLVGWAVIGRHRRSGGRRRGAR